MWEYTIFVAVIIYYDEKIYNKNWTPIFSSFSLFYDGDKKI